jgi:CRISPR-associated protein Csd1
MTILQALERYYHRLEGVAEPGRSDEKFGWCIVLDHEGEVVDVANLHDHSGKKPRPRLYPVPAAVKRTVGIAPNLLWDKTAYVLGRTAGEGKRTAQEHARFVADHLERLAGQEDEGLVALRRFLEQWTPERFDQAPFRPEMLDANVMFRLAGEMQFLHDRPAARVLATRAGEPGDSGTSACLVTGEAGPVARLHPTIKGVEGAQSSGAALVSFNLDTFTSLDKEQGDNAPTSAAAAFRYGAALNRMLARDGGNRLRRPVGDATIVFWADASNAAAAEAADSFFAQWLDSDISDIEQAGKVREQMELVAKGRPIADLRADLVPGTRFHVLGLSPNAARLSVRFWETDTLDAFAQRLARHHQDLRIDPAPLSWGAAPSVSRLLARTTALQGEFKNIPPLLAGEVMRAVLTGGRYPLSLLSAALIRLRAGDSAATGWHAAVIRAVLNRLDRKDPQIPEAGETPMSLNRDHQNTGYQLGRLFAVYELAQRAALGGINSTIRDKYFGAASATPASVFPLIVRGGQNHLSKVRKTTPGWAVLIERELEEINGRFDPAPGGIWPRSLPLRDQGEFAVGYYHQRATKLTNGKGIALEAKSLEDTAATEGGDE